MEVSNKKVKEYNRRMVLSRMRILCDNGFYGLLLMHMKISLGNRGKNAWTDGERLWFNPDFLEKISDAELDYAMLHLITHVILKHTIRRGNYEAEEFWNACDIIVNSNILKSNNMDEKSITLRDFGGVQPHLFRGKEGCNYSVEELCALMQASNARSPQNKNGKGKGNGECKGEGSGSGKGTNDDGSGDGWDDHAEFGLSENRNDMREMWLKRFESACEAISIRDPSNTRGLLPAFAERMLRALKKPQTDWRTILTEFIQEEVVDYSFMPPDKRFDECPFFLPDYNEKGDTVEDILFMVDTSGSMSDAMITAAYSEIKGAIDQFDGRLKGWLGFFDAVVYEPKPFETEEAFQVIRPQGGGGTDFQIVFQYVTAHMQDKLPVSIILLTDGDAPFPYEAITGGIPVLWLLNNEEVEPPWGKIARIIVED